MNNSSLGYLITEATKEAVERSRIKAQMRKLRAIIDADTARRNKAYSELGKFYYEDSLKTNSARVNFLKKLISHLNERIEKAETRYEDLELAHSVDDCSQALKTQVTTTLKNAKSSTTTLAKDLSNKARGRNTSATTAPMRVSKIKLTREQDDAIYSAIKKELKSDPETAADADSTLSKIHDILDALSEGESAEAEAGAKVSAIVEEAIDETLGKDEVAEDFTF